MKTRKQNLLINSLYTLSIAVLSLLLVAYAYDLSLGETIKASSTKKSTQDIFVSIARFLGVKGSIVLGVLVTGASLYYTMNLFRNNT